MQDSTPLLYSRGFLLSDTEEPLLEGLQHYAKRQVGAKVLYHDQITPVETHTCQDGWLTTIGTVLEAKSNRDSNPPGSIAARLWTSFHNGGLDALEGELYDLGGRYAVFASNGQDTWVYHDASGTRAVYYDVGSGNVGSHFDMLERLCVYRPVGSSPIEKLRLDLRNRRTAHPEILSLLPNHRLNIQRASQERFFLHRPNSARTVDFESKIQTVIGSWESQLSRAVEQADHIGFSMTGGWDSRLLLALASKFSDSFTSFTYTYAGATRGEPPKNQWDESMKLDHDIVNRLKPFLPTSHTFIPKTEESQDVWRQAHLSTLKRNSEGAHGRWLLSDYMKLFKSRNSLHYRGNLIGLGRLNAAEPNRLEDPFGRLRALVKNRAGREPETSSLALDIHGSAEACEQYESVHSDYELTDVWYWENRLARWYAQLLNETDVAFDTFTPFNTRRIIDSFLSLHPEDRKDGLMQWELIYRGNPYLTFYDANAMGDLYRKHASDGLPRPW